MSFLYQHKYFVFLLICFAYANNIQAQLIVEKNTLLAIDADFTSLERQNFIYEDIKGEGHLIFIASHNQELITEHLTKLPNLSIQTLSSFTFYTAIQVEGDLSLNADVVSIASPIYLKGKLLLDAYTVVYGKHHIQFQT